MYLLDESDLTQKCIIFVDHFFQHLLFFLDFSFGKKVYLLNESYLTQKFTHFCRPFFSALFFKSLFSVKNFQIFLVTFYCTKIFEIIFSNLLVLKVFRIFFSHFLLFWYYFFRDFFISPRNKKGGACYHILNLHESQLNKASYFKTS